MQVDYLDLLEEIEELTTVDGFVAACLEIKESMFFYERELMLAAYTASLELLTTVALFGAALGDGTELKKLEEQIIRCSEGLLADLAEYHLPLDIRFVADRFLQGAGLQFRMRLPVYLAMIRDYVQPSANPLTLDELLLKAHGLLSVEPEDEDGLNELLGQVGHRMLRGGHLRPIWLEVSHPRIYFVLLGLQTMMNNFRVTPYFNFPLEEIGIERQKRRNVKGKVVSDLGVVRNFRQGGSGYTELNVMLTRDAHDDFLERILSAQDYSDLEPDGTVVGVIKTILQLRLVYSGVDGEIVKPLLAYCRNWQIAELEPILQELKGVVSG